MKGRFFRLPFPLFFFILFVNPLPSHSTNLNKYHQVSMGTVIEITLLSEDEEAAKKATLQAFQEIKRIEQLMSPWIGSSDVTRLNRSAGKEWVKVSPETFDVIQRAQKISGFSEGAFDITIAPLTQLWRKAREKGVPPPPEEVKKILNLVNFRNLLIQSDGKAFLKKKGMAIDLGGIAKGYAVDRAFEILTSLGYKNLIVNAGGDLRTGGLKYYEPWSIGIQNPRSAEKVMATVSVSDSAIATSGDYEKFFFHQGKRYHHILNPNTGFPAVGCQSVTILSKDGMTADGLATAVFVLGPEKGYALCQRLQDVQCFIVDREGMAVMTPGLKDRISFNP
jgi:thiamine biosynthesis lipoprotein